MGAIMHLSSKKKDHIHNSINVFKTKQKLSNTFNTLRNITIIVSSQDITYIHTQKNKHIKRIANKDKNMAISQ